MRSPAATWNCAVQANCWGTRQTGLAELRVADLIRDADLLPQVRSTAELLLRENAACIAPLRVRWIGGAEEYGRIG